jgi:hypothetical protein
MKPQLISAVMGGALLTPLVFGEDVLDIVGDLEVSKEGTVGGNLRADTSIQAGAFSENNPGSFLLDLAAGADGAPYSALAVFPDGVTKIKNKAWAKDFSGLMNGRSDFRMFESIGNIEDFTQLPDGSWKNNASGEIYSGLPSDPFSSRRALEVEGHVKVKGNLVADMGIQLKNGGITFSDGSILSGINQLPSSGSLFDPSGVKRVNVTNTGVGINVEAPEAALHVQGDAIFSGLVDLRSGIKIGGETIDSFAAFVRTNENGEILANSPDGWPMAARGSAIPGKLSTWRSYDHTSVQGASLDLIQEAAGLFSLQSVLNESTGAVMGGKLQIQAAGGDLTLGNGGSSLHIYSNTTMEGHTAVKGDTTIEGNTILNGNVTIAVPQGDISMGAYQ